MQHKTEQQLKNLVIGAAFVCSTALPFNVRAEEVNRVLSVAPTVGYSAANSAIGLRSGFSYGLRMGYELAGPTAPESVGLEASVAVIDARSATGTGGEAIRYGLNAVVPLLSAGHLTPLLTAGAGGVSAGGNNYLALAYGAGLKYSINDYLAIRGDVRDLVVFNVGATGNSLEYVVGLSYTLDRQRQPALASLSESAQDALPSRPTEVASTVAGEPAAGAPIAVPVPTGESRKDAQLDIGESGKDVKPAAVTPALPATQTAGNSSAEAVEAPFVHSSVSVGMPEPIKRPARRLMQVTVEFASKQATVAGRYLRRVSRAARWLRRNPAATVEITGHADSTGKQQYNKKLSRRRAVSVKRLLVKRGVDPARIRSRGAGSTHSVADNRTAAGRQRNRRAVATINAPVTPTAKGAEK